MSCGVGHRSGSTLALLWLWHRPVAAALTGPLAWELPYAMGTVLKRQKEKRKIHATQCSLLHYLQELRVWKQTKCLLTGEWIKKMWYIYTVDYYLAIKKDELMPFEATWMDLEIIILSEVRQ